MIVRPVSTQRRSEALSLLTGRHFDSGVAADFESLIEQADAGELCLDGLLVAESGGEAVGAALYVLQPGSIALVWPPGTGDSGDPHLVADALLTEVGRRIDAAGCRLAQCLLEPGSFQAPVMERHGFARLTELAYLERSLQDPLPPASNINLTAVEFDPQANRERFAALLGATYDGTLDCPELNGRRTADETLEGHRGSGRFDPSLWKLYCTGSDDVALLLLSDHPDLRAWEVVYMGVAPHARGRGFGRALLTRALHEAQAAGCEAVVLAVDIRNRFALRVYEELGFRELCRRVVHLRVGP